jgi:hypothetical protein
VISPTSSLSFKIELSIFYHFYAIEIQEEETIKVLLSCFINIYGSLSTELKFCSNCSVETFLFLILWFELIVGEFVGFLARVCSNSG